MMAIGLLVSEGGTLGTDNNWNYFTYKMTRETEDWKWLWVKRFGRNNSGCGIIEL